MAGYSVIWGPGTPGEVAATSAQASNSALSSDLSTNEYGNSFTAEATGGIVTVVVEMSNGVPATGNCHIKIYDTSAGLPNTQIGKSDDVDVSTIGVSAQDVTFTFSTPVEVLSGSVYAFMLEADSALSGVIGLRRNTSGSYAGGQAIQYTGSYAAIASQDITPFSVTIGAGDPTALVLPAGGLVGADGGSPLVPLKTQTKYLTANATSDVTITDLTFSNLTIGQWYRIKLQVYLLTTSSDAAVGLKIIHNSGTIGYVEQTSDGSTTNVSCSDTIVEFKAVATTLTFLPLSATANAYVGGTTSTESTYATLSEIQPMQETSEW